MALEPEAPPSPNTHTQQVAQGNIHGTQDRMNIKRLVPGLVPCPTLGVHSLQTGAVTIASAFQLSQPFLSNLLYYLLVLPSLFLSPTGQFPVAGFQFICVQELVSTFQTQKVHFHFSGAFAPLSVVLGLINLGSSHVTHA